MLVSFWDLSYVSLIKTPAQRLWSVVLGQINLIFFQNKDLFCPPRKTTVHLKTFLKHVTFPKFEMDKIEIHALRNVSEFTQVELIFIEKI